MAEPMSAELDALLAARLATSAILAMLLLDALPVGAVVVIVMDFAMLWRVLERVRVVRRHLGQDEPPGRKCRQPGGARSLFASLSDGLRCSDRRLRAVRSPEATPVAWWDKAPRSGQ